MGCSASSQARTVETSPQHVQAAAQTNTNQAGSSASPNVDHPKTVQFESTTSENTQEKNNQADESRAGK